jgi:hypothetical protein
MHRADKKLWREAVRAKFKLVVPEKSAEKELSHAEYLQSGEALEIWHEQLYYLWRHAGAGCMPGCVDCQRLNQVKGWLELPFRGR